MGAGKRRVDISFDRERDTIRAIVDTIARLRGSSVAVAVTPQTQPILPIASSVASGDPTIERSSELERFARELKARSEVLAQVNVPSTIPPERIGSKRLPERRGTERRAAGGGKIASVLLPERSQQVAERRASERTGTGWTPFADRYAVRATEPPPHPTSPPAVAPRADALGDPRTTSARAARYLGSLAAAYGPLEAADESESPGPLVDVLVLDTSALAALARGNVRARAHLSRAVGALARIVVPELALVDAAHTRVAHAVAEIESVDAALAGAAARMIADTGLVAPTTALAVASAARSPRTAVLTADAVIAAAYARASARPTLYVFEV